METKLSAFIVGYTGEVGKEVVKEVLKSQKFSRVVLFGRREVKYEDPMYKNVEQKVIDFDKLDEQKDLFKNLKIGFCCLGTTRGKSGSDGFYKVDHDYVMNSAKVAKENGCSQFHLVSSAGANHNSLFLYPKTKGQVEEELKAMDFDKLFIYRPGLLLCDREESRAGETFFKVLSKPLVKAFPTFMSVPTSVVARAMVNYAISPPDDKVLTFGNKEIHAAGKEASQSDITQNNPSQ